MEILSYELTTRLAKRRPTRITAMSGGAYRLPAFLVASMARLLLGCARGSVGVLHLGDPVLAPLAVIAKAFGVPTVVTIHGLDVTYDHPLYRLWRRIFLGPVDACVCISDASRRAAIQSGVAAGRTSVIGIGIDVATIPRSSAPREDDLLLFVGRLARRKGLAWFVGNVLPALCSGRPRLRLAVLGDGPERQRVVEAAVGARVLDRLIFLGALTDEQKWDWYARASVCIMPNISVDADLEGYGIVALEAMAAGCPLVVADVDGLRDAIGDGDAGGLLAAEDAPAWRVALRALLDDRALRNRRGADARCWVESARDWDTVIGRYDALFTALMAQRAALNPSSKRAP